MRGGWGWGDPSDRSASAGQPALERPPLTVSIAGIAPVADALAPEEAAPGLGFQPGAPRASNGIVPTSSQRTRSPRKTGPSTHARTMRVTPSLPTAGSTQPMHRPVPQVMAGSDTSAWTGMPYRPAMAQTDRSTGTGADA